MTQMYKQFPRLVSLDSYRKAVDMPNMRDVLPVESNAEIKYAVAQVEWFNQDALNMSDPEKGRY